MAGLRTGESEVGMAGGFFRLGLFQALDLALDDKFLISAELHAVFFSKALRAFRDKIDVRALVKHEASGLYGIANALNAADTAGTERGAIHHEGVELHAAVAGEKAAAAGVKDFIVFHADDGGFYRIQRGAAA